MKAPRFAGRFFRSNIVVRSGAYLFYLLLEREEVLHCRRLAVRVAEKRRRVHCSHHKASVFFKELTVFLGDLEIRVDETDCRDPPETDDYLRVNKLDLLLKPLAAGGDLLFLTSTAGQATYPGGAGYVAAKHAERIIANTLRLELVGEPVRVIEIAPGLVATEEFSLNRLHGDAAAAARVYEGVAEPLVADDVAECIVWALERPAHVNIDSLTVRPRAQASNTVVARDS